jgi:hypothetical protein
MSSLLPSDKYLASMLGLTDEEYSWFKAEVRKRSAEAPEPAVVAGTIDAALAIAIINLVIGVGLTVVSTLLRPKPSFDEPGRPPELRATSSGGQTTTQNQRFAPRYGFNSTQEISTLGSIVPLVYTNKETIASIVYGGVRVNTQLLWSQIYSLGGSQMLRAIFLVGEGPIAAIEPSNFASGGNTLTSYDFGATANSIGSRMTIYGRYASGLTTRIRSDDRIYGRQASEDPGNESSSNVYAIRVGSSVTSDFSAAEKPANQTTFGLYGFCGNNFAYRPNPTFEPIVKPQLVPYKKDGETKVKCITDESKWAVRRKQQIIYSSRSGITTQGIGTIGGQTVYNLYSSSDKNTAFSRAIRDIFTISDWDIDLELSVDTTGTTLDVEDTSSGGNGKAKFKYNDTNNTNTSSSTDALAQQLLGRFTATIKEISEGPGVTPGPANDWGYVAYSDNLDNTGSREQDIAAIAVKVEFNTSSMSLPEIQLLKASKFKVKLTNDLVGDDPEDDITIIQTHQMTVTSDSFIELSTDEVDENFSLSKSTFSFTVGETTYSALSGVDLEGGLLNREKVIATSVLNATYQWSRVPANDTANYYTLVSYLNLKDIFAETCEDIAASIAGRQTGWDNSIVLGELYKIGSGLAVCTDRTGSPFTSNADAASPQSVAATFKTVRAGVVGTNSQADIEMDGDDWYDASPRPSRNTATTDGHIMRCAIASFSTSRPCSAVEVGIRSRLGIKINNIAAFNTLKNNRFCDDKACLDFKGNILDEGASLYTNNYRSNTVSSQVERYSFFKIYYRRAGASTFTELQYSYGVRGSTSENIFNYFQIAFNGDVKIWEFQLEPLSGWEVREYRSASQLYVLEAGLPEQVIGDSGLTVRFNGAAVPGTADTFAISVGRRGTGLDTASQPFQYPESDANYSNNDKSLIDTWGKLAESFIFDEVVSSASAPEHEVTYCNEIVSNPTPAPAYDNLALIGANVSSSVEWQQFSQFSCYVTGGKTCRQLRSSLAVGATHLLPDIVLDLMTNSTYGRGDLITDDMVNFTEFTAAANWCYSRKYFFDGVIADKINIRKWCADVAATHLLIFGESDGKFFLRPALQFDAVAITGLFSAGNIVENSFKLQYFDPEERDPIQISVRYREERASTNLDNPGMFPTVREVLVRESSASETVSLETIDMSDYCTSRQHAIDAAKFVVRMRRIPTHTVSFTTTHEGVLMAMAPGDYIKVGMDATEYDEFNNGVVTPEGALVSTKSLADGSYDVIAWNGDADTAPADTTLAVSNSGKTATPTGVVFTVKLPSTQVRTYQIERITPTEEGTFTIEAVHMPTNSSDILELADGFDTAGNWSIQD